MGRKRLQHKFDSRRDEILERAWELLIRDGLECVTLNRLLQSTGTSKGAFYHYFNSFDELLDDVVERVVTLSLEGLAEHLRDPAVEPHRKLSTYLGISSERPPETLLLRGLYLQVHHAGDLELLARLMNTAHRLGVAHLEDLLRSGIARDVWATPFPSEMADLLLSAWERTLVAVFDLAKERPADRQLEDEILKRLEATTHATELLLSMQPGTLDRFARTEVKGLLDTSQRVRAARKPPESLLGILEQRRKEVIHP